MLLWSDEDGSRSQQAEEYIQELEGEVARLRESLAALRRASDGRNELLETIRQMEPSNLAELTARASADVLEAMEVFVTRLMGGLEGDGLAFSRGSLAGPELARILYWLLIVGYSLRTLEVRFDLDEQLRLPDGTIWGAFLRTLCRRRAAGGDLGALGAGGALASGETGKDSERRSLQQALAQ